MTHRLPIIAAPVTATPRLAPIIGNPVPGVKRKCANPRCATEFLPNSGKQRFCTRSCWQKHVYHRFCILPPKRTCARPGCRRTFTEGTLQKLYCSEKCGQKVWSYTPAAIRFRESQRNPPPRRQERCDHCNEILTGLWSQRWCNRECEKAFMRLPREHPRCLARECGAEIIGGRSHRKYCSDLCAWREADRRKAERRIATRRLAAVA